MRFLLILAIFVSTAALFFPSPAHACSPMPEHLKTNEPLPAGFDWWDCNSDNECTLVNGLCDSRVAISSKCAGVFAQYIDREQHSTDCRKVESHVDSSVSEAHCVSGKCITPTDDAVRFR